jgi:hypothetical protein
MRLGFDVSPLHRPHPRGIVRVVAGLADALERRGRVEIVRLAPEAGAHSARWRQVELPRAEARLGLAGIHSCLSAFALSGRGRRVQTIHELPWLHGVDENAGWRHRIWARLGPRRADLVLTATETTARDVRAYSGASAGACASCRGVSTLRSATQPRRRRRAESSGSHAPRLRAVRRRRAAQEAQRCGRGRRGRARETRRPEPRRRRHRSRRRSTAAAGGARFLGELDDAEMAALYRQAAPSPCSRARKVSACPRWKRWRAARP